MKNIFRPIWVGENYENSGIFDKRVLVIAESTYNEEGKDTSQYNLSMAEDHIYIYKNNEPIKMWLRYRERLVKACLNKQLLSINDVERFWHSIAFFIFVEETLPGSGVRPTEKQWQNHRPIVEVVEKYEPDLIILTGCELFDWWIANKPINVTEYEKVCGARREQTYKYVSKAGKVTKIYGMRHPTFCSPQYEYSFLKSAGVKLK